MSTDSTSPEKDTDVRERRAQYEQFTVVVCENGYVNIRNESYGDDADNHCYSIEVRADETLRCSCPSDEYQPGRCKHRRHIENHRPLILSSASALREFGQ